jgi:hypothetical protein
MKETFIELKERRNTYKETVRKTYRQTDRKTYKQTEREKGYKNNVYAFSGESSAEEEITKRFSRK